MDGGEPEVFVGLCLGLPIIVWRREDCESDEFLTAVGGLLHGDVPGDVLQRLRQIGTTAYRSHAGQVGHLLVLMWDDPGRLVVPADLGPPREHREVIMA